MSKLQTAWLVAVAISFLLAVIGVALSQIPSGCAGWSCIPPAQGIGALLVMGAAALFLIASALLLIGSVVIAIFALIARLVAR